MCGTLSERSESKWNTKKTPTRHYDHCNSRDFLCLRRTCGGAAKSHRLRRGGSHPRRTAGGNTAVRGAGAFLRGDRRAARLQRWNAGTTRDCGARALRARRCVVQRYALRPRSRCLYAAAARRTTSFCNLGKTVDDPRRRCGCLRALAAAAIFSRGMGMGWGDAKLVAISGAVLGLPLGVLALAAACAVAAVLHRLLRGKGSPIAFAPYIAAATALALPLR